MSSIDGPLKPDSAGNLVEVLRKRAEHQADRTAFIFLDEKDGSQTPVTYGELDRRARQVAVGVQDRCTAGETVLLLYPTGVDFIAAFFGCLYAGVASIPLFPPRPHRSLSRIETIIGDANARVALTVSPVQSYMETDWEAHPLLRTVACVSTDTLPGIADADWQEPVTPDRDFAYLQYTSGSTSAPKGVMVTHRNLLYNCHYIISAFSLNEETRAVTWLPHAHDMGLIEGLLTPIVAGYPTMVMSPAFFLRSPFRWLEAITAFRATHSGAPNFAYELCVRKTTPEDRALLDLHSWSMAYSGAEPVRRETMDRFAEVFAPCGFRREILNPCYGLAEATLMVSGNLRGEAPVCCDVVTADLEKNCAVFAEEPSSKTQTLVGCGRVYEETRVVIVDPDTRLPCAPARVGEIWVAGPTVTAGYWNRPEETVETYQARLANGDPTAYLRTGDLGVMRNEVLYVTGRLKDLIILRGGNYYPQDIEWTAENAHPAVRAGCVACFSIEENGEERLVLAAELQKGMEAEAGTDLEAIARAIRVAVFEQFDVETSCIHLLPAGSIHKTSSGKIQRSACRSDFLAGTAGVLWASRVGADAEEGQAAMDVTTGDDLRKLPRPQGRKALEALVRRQAAVVLGLPASRIERRAPLGAYGLDSMKGIALVARLEERLQLGLSDTMIYNYPALEDMTSYLARQLGFDDAAPAATSASSAPVTDEQLAKILTRAQDLSPEELHQALAKKHLRANEESS